MPASDGSGGSNVLGCLPHFRVDDRRVVAFHLILRHLPLVFDQFLGEEVTGELLLQ